MKYNHYYDLKVGDLVVNMCPHFFIPVWGLGSSKVIKINHLPDCDKK